MLTLKKPLIFTVLCMLVSLCCHTSYAKQFDWQKISFEYTEDWDIYTNRTVGGNHFMHLVHKARDGYPVSIMLSFIPKAIKGNQHYVTSPSKTASIIAAEYIWPIIRRYANLSSKDKILITFNAIAVGDRLAKGAVIMAPTPQSNIYISGQTFYVDKGEYFIIGCVISRVDRGVMRRSVSYDGRISSAYALLKSLQVR